MSVHIDETRAGHEPGSIVDLRVFDQEVIFHTCYLFRVHEYLSVSMSARQVAAFLANLLIFTFVMIIITLMGYYVNAF
jgi:hypothetical protein